MTTNFSTTWKRSLQPRKQRKYRYNAPLHIKQKFVHVHLSPILRKKYNLRNVQVKKGDKVIVLRGQYKKKEGKVERVDLKKEKVFVTGIENIKKDGTKIMAALGASNLMITELNLNDKKRRQKLESKSSDLKNAEKDNQKETKKVETKKAVTKKAEKKE